MEDEAERLRQRSRGWRARAAGGGPRHRASSSAALAAFAAFTALACGPAASATAPPLVNVQEVRLSRQDDPRWAEPGLDDSAWPVVPLWEVPETGGIVLLRARIELTSRHRSPERPTGLYFAALAACEVAWDGVTLGRAGRPGATAERELPGLVESHWVVPESRALPGAHRVALRCSAHHRRFDPYMGYWALLAGDYDTLLAATQWSARTALISLSGMLLVGIFALVLFLADRRDRSFLLLGLFSLCGGALLLAESWRTLFGYTYDLHIVRLLAITALTALLNLALVGFVVVRFPAPSSRPTWTMLGASLLLALAAPGWDNKALVMLLAGLALATAWVARAARRRERGSLPALAGLAATLAILLWRPFQFTDLPLYFALDLLLACLLVAHALQVRHLRREHEAALVKSARLEVELLRKHIQPHFLMNTLTALSEWIEAEPAVAVRLIEAVSEEFRILARIADRPLIGLGEELALCRIHVAIMSRRRDREYELQVAGTDERDLVPPAVFHTLVENAITHDESGQGLVVLTLAATLEGERVRYVFTAPYTGAAGADLPGGGEPAEGTGLRYIRARLGESLGDAWSFAAGPAGGLWRTEITLARRRA